jgi:uncharacterized membrane protein
LNTFSIGDAISYGWRGFWKNIGPLIVIAIVVFAINIVFSLIAAPIDNVVLRTIIQIIGWIIGLLISLGWIRVALKITAGEKPEIANLFEFEGFPVYIGASIVFGIAASIGLVLCIIPGIIVYLIWGFYGFVIADRGESTGFGEAFSRSAEITKGNRWNLLGFGIVLLLINFVGLLLCGIGVLFTSGISLVAAGYVYRTISGEPVAEVV